MALERMNPGELAPPSGPFVNAVRAGKLLFISGQVAYGADGQIVGAGDPEAQAVQVMENLGANLRAAGARARGRRPCPRVPSGRSSEARALPRRGPAT